MWNAIRAEFIKLTTTKSFYITSLLYVLIAAGLAGMSAYGTRQLAQNPEFAGSEVEFIVEPRGLIFTLDVVAAIVMVQAVLMVTSEYSRNQSTATFTAMPRRWRVAAAKCVLYAVVVAILSFLTLILVLYVGKIMGGEAASSMQIWGDDYVQHALWAKPVALVLSIVFAMGFAWLLRNTAGAMLVVLVWSLGLELILGNMLPRVGTYISGYGPFNHLTAFQTTEPVVEGPDWDPILSGLYFAVWAAVILVAGLLAMKKRDA
ncbi:MULTISPECIES: ABC transporter permease subunit [Corynebacterium]|uniref:ABC transporter permease subunit n=1 Tax=Corynebacterium TaxID=1716 RepID=UPI00124E9E58|nr:MULTISPECIES: ABC transporter permease subunit [Corynebacterium]